MLQCTMEVGNKPALIGTKEIKIYGELIIFILIYKIFMENWTWTWNEQKTAYDYHKFFSFQKLWMKLIPNKGDQIAQFTCLQEK